MLLVELGLGVSWCNCSTSVLILLSIHFSKKLIFILAGTCNAERMSLRANHYRPFLFLVSLLWTPLTCFLRCLAVDSDVCSVRDFGAKGDGATDDTAAFQRALDQAAKSGGGA